MKIKSLRLVNFKRFTDLTLKDIPQDTKLVLLIGSNGSGKSSVFDAFGPLSMYNGKYYRNPDLTFQKTKGSYDIIIDTYEFGTEGFINNTWKNSGKLTSTSFYGRTSFRQIPRLNRTFLGSGFNVEVDSDIPATFIDRDERFENDLEHIFGKLLKEYFVSRDKSEIIEKVIDPINISLERIFGSANGTKLKLVEIIPPLEGKIAEINFTKGNSTFHYHYLSAGEKEVFNILINLVARREYFTDTIYYYDEIDLHLSTKLQYNFLRELVEYWLPENCQFWTASHSLGFIQYAKNYDKGVIFDFDDYNFDKPKILTPEVKDNPNLYLIAVDKESLSDLFQGLEVVFVENKDKNHYASADISKTVFIPENGRNGVYHKVKNGDYKGIVDRDFLTDSDIELIKKRYTTLKILSYYSIENYLYHPDNLEEYYTNKKAFDKKKYIEEITTEKNKVRNEIIPSLSLKRTEYPYFGEPDFNGKPEQERFKNKKENITESQKLAEYLNSDELEDFYKVFPMKSYATQLDARQNIPKTELAKTDWFKQQIQNILK